MSGPKKVFMTTDRAEEILKDWPDALVAALQLETAAGRRKELRALATPILNASPLINHAEWSINSPLIGRHLDQIFATTPAAIRDRLHTDTLIDLILCDSRGEDYAIRRLVDALRTPDIDGIICAKSKVGYVFGLNEALGGAGHNTSQAVEAATLVPRVSGVASVSGTAGVPAVPETIIPASEEAPAASVVGGQEARNLSAAAVSFALGCLKPLPEDVEKRLIRAFRMRCDEDGKRITPRRTDVFAVLNRIYRLHPEVADDKEATEILVDALKATFADLEGSATEAWQATHEAFEYLTGKHAPNNATPREILTHNHTREVPEYDETAYLLTPQGHTGAVLYRDFLTRYANVLEGAGLPIPSTISSAVESLNSKKDTITMTNTATNTATSAPALAITAPTPEAERYINLTLSAAGLPEIGEMLSRLGNFGELQNELETAREAANERANKADKEAASLRQQLSAAAAKAMTMMAAPVVASGEIPAGKVTMVNAGTVFETRSKMFKFELPAWEWDGVHPHVPAIDPDYIFRPKELLMVLYALVSNEKAYLHGHTGTGKTTLVEQVAARLNWPFIRVNFDSEITRADLVGRDKLSTNAEGKTVSEFVEGIMPRILSGPYIGCLDEIDFVQEDVAYVLQRALEGNGMMLNEDGGRVVQQHPMCRIIGTGNTVGQGDEHGMYQGAKAQSMAFLDRFTIWVGVDYLEADERRQLIQKASPSLSEGSLDKICRYVTEHMEAFTTSRVLQPISPRGFINLAKKVAWFEGVGSNEKTAIQLALESSVLAKATAHDRVVLKALADRLF